MTGWGSKSGGGAGGSGVPNVPGNTSTPDPAFSVYGEALAVPSGVETTILTWVVPAPIVHLMRVEFGGQNIGEYRLKFGATVQSRSTIWFSGPLNGTWNFETMAGGGVPVASGTVVRVTVLHARPMASDHHARIQYLEIN